MPVTVKALLTVVVPDTAPIERVVAAPAKLTVVALALTRLKEAAVVVMSPPLTARSPAVVMLPVAPVIDQYVPERSLAPADKAVTISASETSMAVVIPPAAEVISRAVVTASSMSALVRTKRFSVAVEPVELLF